MTTAALSKLSQLISDNTKLKDLKNSGFGPGTDPVGKWVVAWSHYAVAGDGKGIPPTIDQNGMISVNGVQIGPDNTVGDLMSAISKN